MTFGVNTLMDVTLFNINTSTIEIEGSKEISPPGSGGRSLGAAAFFSPL